LSGISAIVPYSFVLTKFCQHNHGFYSVHFAVHSLRRFDRRIMKLISNSFTFHGMIAASPLHAEDCQKRIANADHHLYEAAAKHGWNSSEADHYRRELADAREYCWNHGYRWRDEDTHSWHTEHDWNDHDHNP
jgi:hypothetical protein